MYPNTHVIKENWVTYKERIRFHFNTNGITSSVSVFLRILAELEVIILMIVAHVFHSHHYNETSDLIVL